MNDSSSGIHFDASTTSPMESNSNRKDIAWRHAKKLGNFHIQCNYCKKEFHGGGITRLKEHLLGLVGNNKSCLNVPPEVVNEITVSLDVKREMRRKKKQSKMLIDSNETDEEEDIHELDSDSVEIRTKKNKKKSSMIQQTLPGTFAGKDAVANTHMEIAKFFYDACIPFNACNSPYFQTMFDNAVLCGPAFRVPKYHALRVPLLRDTKAEVESWVEFARKDWKDQGCTIMADGWTSVSHRILINFLVYSPKGVIFWRSVDVSDIVRNAEALSGLFLECIEWVGPRNVIQIVTDNTSNFRAAGELIEVVYPHISWSPCAAHCINLALKEIGDLPNVARIVKCATDITKWVYNHLYWLAWLRKREGWTEIIRAGPTRFASNFITLQSLYSHKHDLQALIVDREFVMSRLANEAKTKEFIEIVWDRKIWIDIELIVKVMEPLLRLLRVVDSDKVPSLGFVYRGMKKAQKEMKCVFNNVKDDYCLYLDIVKRRWDNQLKRHLHAAAYWLNPQYQYDEDLARIRDKPDIQAGIINVIEAKGGTDRYMMSEEMMTFRSRMGSFGKDMAIKMVNVHHPSHWWRVYGYSAPHLQQLALRILAQTSSSSGCERN